MEAILTAAKGGTTESDLMIHQWKVLGWLLDLDETRGLIVDTIASWQSATSISQHRKWHRMPLTRDILVTPIIERANAGLPQTAPFEARTKDISPEGLSFFCFEPLPHRRVIVDIPDSGLPGLHVALTWCRFTRQQTYQCGGFFCGVEHA